MPVLKTLVDAQIKTAFQARAGMAHMSESDLLRSVVIEALAISPPQPAIFDTPVTTAIEQLTVRMAAPLMRMARTRATSAGMSSSRWIAALVKSNLERAPIMTDNETEALRASNRELASLARNLVRMTRIINENPAAMDLLKADQLGQLACAITVNRQVIQSLLDVNQQYWGASR